MKGSRLTQFLVDVTRGPLRDAFSADRGSVVAASTLDPALRSAVLEQDVATLWLAGAHPMALLYFARASGWDNDRYYRCLSQAEVTRGGSAAVVPKGEPEPSRTHRSNAPHAR